MSFIKNPAKKRHQKPVTKAYHVPSMKKPKGKGSISKVLKARKKRAKDATKAVSRGLAVVALKNPNSVNFLGSYKYIIVDKKGILRGTDRERIGVGKLRAGKLRLSTEGLFRGASNIASKDNSNKFLPNKNNRKRN